MIKRIFISAAAACMTLAMPLASNALTTEPAPLKVTQCTVDYTSVGTGGVTPGLTNGVTVTVKNLSTKTVTAFSGGGMYNKATITDSFTHTIAPGGVYTFQKNYKPFVYTGSMAACFVSKVTFADGTSWSAGAM